MTVNTGPPVRRFRPSSARCLGPMPSPSERALPRVGETRTSPAFFVVPSVGTGATLRPAPSKADEGEAAGRQRPWPLLGRA